MKLNEIREWLAREDIQLTKSLGQNFLHDEHQLDRIVAASELCSTDKVLEIGPGLGPLTERLVEKAGEVFAIEKDQRLFDVLQQRFPAAIVDSTQRSAEAQTERPGGPEQAILRVRHDDALDYLQHAPRDWSEWKLVANLPYSVASPILVELAQGERSPQRLVATLQFEVAKRLMAQADDDDYGVLTLLVQLDFEPRAVFKIPSSCFFPEPGVDSGCVTLVRRPTLLLQGDQRRTFVRLVKTAFSQRRKMMLKLLKQNWPLDKLNDAFATLKISPQERAEKLSLDQFVALTELLH
ncbi:MAG TPA: 16S rRNA (adenine(1518)-N(6)/adenine(1519)-N(6))-dimethyltransferase RsmA [Verrucomicrobiae bacterium]|nr:16S rRNA (adenine(1518)-N(6)/adenine(1519)-N(6))-dimethyltransferase RsmA [Verrucomicrobiae bacterium]